MATHEVRFNLPERPLGKADASFTVKRDGSTLGTLKISNGSIVWFPSGTTYGHKMGWVKFDEVMRTNAPHQEKRK